MTVLGWGRERHSGRYAPLGNAGILRCAQNDDVELTKARTTARAKARARARARARAKTKYRDLSTAAAKCAAFGRDDVCYGLKENRQSQEQEQEQDQEQQQRQELVGRVFTFPP